MSFTKRGLSFVITLGENQGTFEGGANQLGLQNPRSRVTAQSCIGGDTAFAGNALIQIWGMKPEDMARLSILGFDQAKIGNNNIDVHAADAEGNHTVNVFSGGIFSARINYNAMPDVSLELECWATINEQTQAVPATSAQGSTDVAALLQGICAACNPPLTFVNHGVSAVLANHATGGSPAQQIEDICTSAGICYTLQGGTLTVWPKDQSTDGVVVTTGPGMGMVGFPEYNMVGIDVTMEFNPEVQIGRQLTINSTAQAGPAIPGLPGTYWINVVSHDLSCELPGGPWFTHASLSNQQIVGRA
jgi:hypothetical protein